MTTHLVSLDVPVAWGDMDTYGHVNNTVYLRWFESGRMKFFEQVRVPMRNATQTCAPILARTSCNFLAPVVYPDTVTVHTALSRIGTKSFTMSYRVHSRALDTTAAEGDGTIVWYDYEANASVAVPQDLRERLEPYCSPQS